MIRLPYRRLALWLLFAGGIGSILATSRPGYYIGHVTIEPEFRCPNTDVRVEWTGGEPAPVVVSVDGVEIPPVDATALVIPAGRFDRDARESTLVFTIQHPEARQSASKTVRTLQGSETIDVFTGVGDCTSPDVVVPVSSASYAVIEEVGISWPWPTRCGRDETERTITWQVIKDGKTLTTLHPETGYASPLPAAISADGPWTFRYIEQVTGKQCKPGYWDDECRLNWSFKARFQISCTE